MAARSGRGRPGFTVTHHSPTSMCLSSWLQPDVRVLSCSYGGYEWSQAEEDGIAANCAANQLFVAAAGNENKNASMHPS